MVYSAQFEPYWYSVVEAHAVLNTLTWALLMPIGAILIKVVPGPYAWLVHTAVMSFGLVLFTAGVAMGIWQTYLWSSYHQLTGLIVFGLAMLQPVWGFIHHSLYVKINRRTVVSFIHIFVGRVLITLGAINAGLGLMYAARSGVAANICYGLFAGLIWAAYFVIAFYYDDRKEKEQAEKLARLDKLPPVGKPDSEGKLYED